MSNLFTKQLETIQFEYENIQINRISNLVKLYAEDAVFKDPFQEVHGRDAIAKIFAKMFSQLDGPSFKIISAVGQDFEASLLWEFHFRFKRWNTNPQNLRGVSWLKFNELGLINSHIDYWDPAEGIYEKLPLLGSIMRLLKSSV